MDDVPPEAACRLKRRQLCFDFPSLTAVLRGSFLGQERDRGTDERTAAIYNVSGLRLEGSGGGGVVVCHRCVAVMVVGG